MSSSIRTAPPGVYDATTLLGFGKPTSEVFPEPNSGELILRYDGWSLQDLRDNDVVRAKGLMWDQDWYNQFPWSAEKLPSGLYAFRLPVPDSYRKTFEGQKALLLPGEEPAHVVLAASALLVHLLSTGVRCMNGHWLRCREGTSAGYCAELSWAVGRLYVYNYRDCHVNPFVWLASARRLPEPCPSSP